MTDIDRPFKAGEQAVILGGHSPFACTVVRLTKTQIVVDDNGREWRFRVADRREVGEAKRSPWGPRYRLHHADDPVAVWAVAKNRTERQWSRVRSCLDTADTFARNRNLSGTREAILDALATLDKLDGEAS